MTTWELHQSLLNDGFEQCDYVQGVEAFQLQRNGPKKFFRLAANGAELICRPWFAVKHFLMRVLLAVSLMVAKLACTRQCWRA